MTNELPTLKRVVIKEELVALTGGHVPALILNQLIYWSSRVRDASKFMREELERLQEKTGQLSLDRGWIYKSLDELADELMLEFTPVTVGRHLQILIDGGWVARRRNPKVKRDRTFQYRVNLIAVQADLMALGYVLSDYPISSELYQAILPSLKIKVANSSDEGSNLKNEGCNLKNEGCNLKNVGALPEITTEITSKSKKHSAPSGAGSAIKRKKSDYDKIRLTLQEKFTKLTKLPPPSSKAALNKRWLAPLLELYSLYEPRKGSWVYSDISIGKTLHLISVTYQEMKKPRPGMSRGLTVDSPASVSKTARSLWADMQDAKVESLDVQSEYARLNKKKEVA